MLTLNLRCTRCNGEFPVSLDVYRSLDYTTLPKRCPMCCDELQGRPDIVLERKTLLEFTVRVHSSFAALFSRATEFRPVPTDDPSRRLTVKGSDYGAAWSGRIDLFSHVWPVPAGTVLIFALNEVRRKVWYVEKSFRTSGFQGYVVSRTTSRRVLPTYIPVEGESEVKSREEVNEYVLLNQNLDSTAAALEQQYLPLLCWVEAYSKTTLKGLGRQFHRSITGTPIWSQSVQGGARSYRYDTVGMLAVCDPMDPVKVVGTGDVYETETIYS